jgi:transcriptional regulator with XRE-family HTH domain
MHTLRLLFGFRVRDLRIAAGLKQDEFAEICGFARSYMSRIETGGANPSLDAIEVLAAALKVPVRDLFPES